jgi:hypothetical protein
MDELNASSTLLTTIPMSTSGITTISINNKSSNFISYIANLVRNHNRIGSRRSWFYLCIAYKVDAPYTIVDSNCICFIDLPK